MKIHTIHYTSRFIKNFKKLNKQKQNLSIKREQMFRSDAFDSKLKTHKLSGQLEGYWSFSVTHSDRVLFRFIKAGEVIFYKIGGHEIYR